MGNSPGFGAFYTSDAWSCPHCPATFRPAAGTRPEVAERQTRKARDEHRCPPVLPLAVST